MVTKKDYIGRISKGATNELIAAFQERVRNLEAEAERLKGDIFKTKDFQEPDGLKGIQAVDTYSDEQIQHVKVDMEMLTKTLRALKTLGFEEVWMCVKDDFPIIFKAHREDTTGVVLAPITKE